MYTLDRLKKLLAEVEFEEYVFVSLCAGESKKWAESNKDRFMEDMINTYKQYDGVDEDLIPVLTELNEKGYKTSMSCSGHLEQIKNNGQYMAYISFREPYDLGKVPRCNKNNKTLYKWYGNKNGSIEEKENDRKQLMAELLEWAKRLDKCNYNKGDFFKDGWIYLKGEKTFQYKE